MLTRRELLKHAAVLTGMTLIAGQGRAGFKKKEPMQIGACDWSIGKSSDIGAFSVARQIGLDGIQVNLGSDANNMHMREKDRQQAYIDESLRTGIKIASLAIGELNRVPYKSESRTDEWVWDAVDVAHNLDVAVILLAFFAKNDLRGDAAGKKEVIKKLKEVTPKAEKMGVILGIESYLSAEEHMDIIQQVGSKNLKVYYDFRNSADAGYDVIKEINWLGKDMICELHMKENGFRLGEGSMDWKKISEALMEMGYFGDGWMQIESAIPKGAGVIESYIHNLTFLRRHFNIKD